MTVFTELLWVFAIFSFLGWLVRAVLLTFKRKHVCNPGFITLPFFPSVGLSAVVILLITYNMKNYWMIFLGSAIALTVAKYLASMAFERSFGFKWHNYSNKTLNLNGYVGVWELLAYGVLGVLLRRLVIFWVEKLVLLMPLWVALMVGAIVAGIIIADLVFTGITIALLRRNLHQMNDIYKLLHKNKGKFSDEELRAAYEKKMFKNKRFRLRLVRAFPDMESLDYEKQLSDMKKSYEGVKIKNDEVYTNSIDNPEEQPFAYGLCFTKLFWLFVVGSLFGTILETIWAFFTMGHFEVRVGMVWGPFIPVYGGGAVAITLCLYKLHKASDMIIYLASAVIGATFEYFCSYFQEMFLGTVSWDYSDTPFNIDGRTNLMFAMIWGLLGLVWLRYIYPTFSRTVEKIPKKPGRIITIILVVFMAVNGAVSSLAVFRWSQREQKIPPANAIMEWTDNTFTDDYMNFLFPHMSSKK